MQITFKINPKIAEHAKSWIGLLILLSGLATTALYKIVMPWNLEVSHAYYLLGRNDQLRELVSSYEAIPQKQPHQIARLEELKTERAIVLEQALEAHSKGHLLVLPR